jgi:hypothetical protein
MRRVRNHCLRGEIQAYVMEKDDVSDVYPEYVWPGISALESAVLAQYSS